MSINIIDQTEIENQADSKNFIAWVDNLSVGVDVVDKQHQYLILLTNQLFQACRLGGDVRDSVFKETMSRMVGYVRFHFATEQKLFRLINYPNSIEHKNEHDSLIVKVLETTKDYGDKKRFVPNNFVRYLRDWIVSHVAHSDKMFGIYIAEQRKKGLLTDSDIVKLNVDLIN